MKAIKNLTKKPSVDEVAKKGKEQFKKREESIFGFTITDAYAIIKSRLTKTLTDEEIYNLTKIIEDKTNLISDLETNNQQLNENQKNLLLKIEDSEKKVKGLEQKLGNWKNCCHQLYEKLKTTEEKFKKLQLFYRRLNQKYKKNITASRGLERIYHLALSELERVKRERPDITLAEHDNLKKDITKKESEILNLKTELTNITNQRDLLQTKKNNLTASYQTLQNDYTNLETTSNALQVEKDNLQVELNSQRINLTLEKDQESKKVLETIINELGIKVKEITTEEVIAEIKNLLTPPHPNDDIIFTKNQEINELKSELMTIKTNWKPKNDLVEIHPFWLSFIIVFPFFILLTYYIIQKNKKYEKDT